MTTATVDWDELKGAWGDYQKAVDDWLGAVVEATHHHQSGSLEHGPFEGPDHLRECFEGEWAIEVVDGNLAHEVDDSVEAACLIGVGRYSERQRPKVGKCVDGRVCFDRDLLGRLAEKEDAGERNGFARSSFRRVQSDVHTAVALSDDPSGDLQMRSCVLAEADHGRPRDDRWRTVEADTGEVFAQDAQSGDRAGSHKGRLSRASGRRKDDRPTIYLYRGCVEGKIATFEET